MKSFLAAAIQMNSQPDLARNMDQAGEAVMLAARQGALFVTLPENFAFLGSETEKHRLAEPISEAVLRQVPKWAKEYGIWLLAGGFPVRTEAGSAYEAGSKSGKMFSEKIGMKQSKAAAKVFNRAIVADPSGEIVARYDKIHLFDVAISDEEQYRESDLVTPGRPTPIVFDIPGDKKKSDKDGIRVGLSICYDVRFPELYRRLSDMDADILCVPAAFTLPTGEAHWETLLRARAIENSCYVIAPAQTGRHGKKRFTYGHSLIIDPWGSILANAGPSPGMILAEINPEHVRAVRQKLPSLHHRVLH